MSENGNAVSYRLECPLCDSIFKGNSLKKIAKRGAWHWNSEHNDELKYSYERIDVVERGGARVHENTYSIERIPIYVTSFDVMDRIGMEDGMLVIGEDSMVCEDCLRHLRHDDERVLIEERHFGGDRWRCQDCHGQIQVDKKREQNEDLSSFVTDGGKSADHLDTESERRNDAR